MPADCSAVESFDRSNAAYWSMRAPGYSAVNRSELQGGQYGRWRRVLLSRLDAHFAGRPRGSVRVLDVGTGPGFFAVLLAREGFSVTAVDYTARMLEEAGRNAEDLAPSIDFRLMHASSLDFPDGSFDAVLSRNVTWNLREPERACSEWTRVLRRGGLLLNFDANWYRYLFDREALAGRLADRARVSASGVEDDTAGTDVDAMEAIAREAPLSRTERPEWDLQTLRSLGLEAKADTEVWREVWTEAEWTNNASTPLFLVEAKKLF